MAASSSNVTSCQVFLNFRGKELRHQFISHLEKALRVEKINYFIDENMDKGDHLTTLFKEIENSRIALVIFCETYTESRWCLAELVTIYERMKEGKLKVIPIFYKVEPATVRDQKGVFGDALKSLKKIRENVNFNDLRDKWEEALEAVSYVKGVTYDGKSNENIFIDSIVKDVSKQIEKLSAGTSTQGSLEHSQDSEVLRLGKEAKTERETETFLGREQRLKELKEKVGIKTEKTCIVGVVGMHGIGKTTLVKKFFEKYKSRFTRRALLQDISEIAKGNAMGLPGMLLRELLEDDEIEAETYEEAHKRKLIENKVFIVLDGISEKRQIEILLEGRHEWIKEGSKILIATSDRSWLEGLVDDIYVVPPLNHRDGLKHFRRYANKHIEDEKPFTKVSKKIVHYARGHPLALQILGEELCTKPDVAYWEEKLDALTKSTACSSIRDRILKVSYDELSNKYQEAFLDIACFRSHDLVYLTSLLDSSDPEEEKATNIIKALTDKFLINTSDTSRVEMHTSFLQTFATEIGFKAKANKRHQNELLQKPGGNSNVSLIGIFLDLSHMERETPLRKDHFKKMRNLRYLKLYTSQCPKCKPPNKIRIPDELDFPLEEVRCLHWLKYPLHQLPSNFNPKNLVDLKLPYSKIKQIFNNKKEAPRLKWVDLNHSSKLNTLSGLPKAKNLQRLNLEGCTALKTLDTEDLQDMESLVLLNLKGCTGLESFPDIKLVSLKTLVLSNCSNLESFLMTSETLQVLYLDGTAITELPTTLVNLVTLNLKDCKMLVKIPQGFDQLKDLQELVCSGCSKLVSLPDDMENMTRLEILLLDGTTIKKIPHISSLQHLCLSRNKKIRELNDMSQLSRLKWLDLKHCEELLSIPKLPPSLQRLDAHGCSSLKTVTNAMDTTHLTVEHIDSTMFIFTNCYDLDRTAKEEITTYAQRKCQLLSDAIKRCNEGFVPEVLFSTCFPGCEIPSWFCHDTDGSVLKLKLPPHWNESRLVGIALCAVVSLGSECHQTLSDLFALEPNCLEQTNSFQVTCNFNLESKDGSLISFHRLVGCLNKPEGEKKQDNNKASDHVFICYTRCSTNNISCLEGDQHSGTCTPTASFKFSVTDEKARLEVVRCGLRLFYASDEPQKKNSGDTSKRDATDQESCKTPHEETKLQGFKTVKSTVSFNSLGSVSTGDNSTVSDESADSFTATDDTGR